MPGASVYDELGQLLVDRSPLGGIGHRRRLRDQPVRGGIAEAVSLRVRTVARHERLREVVGIGIVDRPGQPVQRALVLADHLEERRPGEVADVDPELRD